jgi:hypothetical protein
MGELIEFKKGPQNVWGDGGGPPPEEAEAESPRLRLLLLPIFAFLDALSLAIAFVCRPVAASFLMVLAALLWAGLRDGLGLGHSLALTLCLLAWLAAHFFAYDLDRLVKRIERAECGFLRRSYAIHPALGRVVHLALYAYVAVAPGVVLAVLMGLGGGASTLPASLRPTLTIGADHPILVLLAAIGLAIAAVTTRYRWHPVARHATILGSRRKLAIAA